MPYVSYRHGDRSFSAFSIPPSAAEGLDPALRKLNEMQFLIQEAGGIAPLAEAVRAASDEQISLAQPQLAYALKEMKERMVSESVAMSGSERGLKSGDVRDARDAVAKAVRVIAQDARDGMAACDKMPGNQDNLGYLDAVMECLAEARIVTAAIALASGDERDQENALAARAAFAELAPQVDAFRSDVGPRYADRVLELVGSSEAFLSRAAKRAAADMGPVPELTDRRIDMAGNGMPDDEELRLLSHRKPDSIAPLRDGAASKIRDAVAAVLSDYHETFAVGGFVRLLKAAAASAHWQAQRYMGYANKSESCEHEARKSLEEDKKSNHRYETTYKTTYEEKVESIRKMRKGYGRDGERAAALAADFRGILSLAARTLRPDMAQERHMAFALDEASGTVVGRFEDEAPGDPVIVLYHDAGCGGYPEAVLLVGMRTDNLADGVPTIDAVRNNDAVKGSNYRSFGDAMSGLGDDFDQRYFVGARFNLVDPASIPAPVAPEAPLIAGPGR